MTEQRKMFEEWFADYHESACRDYGGIDCTDPKGIADAAWQACLAAQPAPQRVAVPEGWKHDCAALLTNDVELWIDACPHCGKPRAAAPQPDGVGDVIQRAIDALQGCMCKSCEDDACCMSNVRQSRDELRALLAKGV